MSAPTAGRPRVAVDAAGDSTLARLLTELAELEDRVASLRGLREQMDPEEYDRELETLLVELALKSREIDAQRGGGGEGRPLRRMRLAVCVYPDAAVRRQVACRQRGYLYSVCEPCRGNGAGHHGQQDARGQAGSAPEGHGEDSCVVGG